MRQLIFHWLSPRFFGSKQLVENKDTKDVRLLTTRGRHKMTKNSEMAVTHNDLCHKCHNHCQSIYPVYLLLDFGQNLGDLRKQSCLIFVPHLKSAAGPRVREDRRVFPADFVGITSENLPQLTTLGSHGALKVFPARIARKL